MKTLPTPFIERLTQIIPSAQLPMVLRTFEHQANTTFRVNTLKAEITSTIAALAEQGIPAHAIAGFDNAFYVDPHDREALTYAPAFLQGDLYIQNLSSMLPALVLKPQPGEEILDLTAAPGSKTSQMAALMKDEGRIAAVEKSKNRFFKLKDNLRKQGVTIAELYRRDGATVWRHCRHRFDRVLLDAPCSSEARFHLSDPDSFHYWSERKIKACARLQWVLLYSAFQCTKPGGELLYSTCSFAPEENEQVVNKLFKKFPDEFEISKISLPLDNLQAGITEWQGKTGHPQLQNSVRILPNDMMSGFYLAHIKRVSP